MKEKPTGSQKEITMAARDSTSSKMIDFVTTLNTMDKAAKAKAKVDTGKAGRIANMYFMQSADHMLHSGIGITSLCGGKASQTLAATGASIFCSR
jgi:hypothetical protein